MKITGQIVPHFSLQEMACNDKAETLLLSPELVRQAMMLEELRTALGKPLVVNSWYRTKEYNDAIDGSSQNSQHVLGCATDIALDDKMTSSQKDIFMSKAKTAWERICKTYGVKGGFGKYKTFFHVDSRKGSGPMSTWDMR